MSTIEKNNYFPSVDILRGFAAITVVIYHVIELYEWKSFPTTGPLIWFRSGWMGVDLFFVISGFVIALSAFSEIDQHGENQFQRPFLKRRIFRVVPLYYLTCLVFMVFIVPATLFERLVPNVLTHLFFIHNFFPGFHGSINGANWSLGTEMQFYLFIAVIAPWLRSTDWWKIAVVFIGTAWLWRWGAQVLFPVHVPQDVFKLFVSSTQLPGMLDEFGLGIILARLVRSPFCERLFTSKNQIENLLKWGSVIIIGFVTFSIYWKYAGYWKFPYMVVFYRTLLGLFFVSILYLSCCLNNPQFIRFTSPVRYLGTISYGIYLWHLPVILSLKQFTWVGPVKAMVLVLLITILFAMVSWHFFEKPIVDRYSKKPIFINVYFKNVGNYLVDFKFYYIAAVILGAAVLLYKNDLSEQARQMPSVAVAENLNNKFELFDQEVEFVPGGACNLDEVGGRLKPAQTNFDVNRSQTASVSGWGVISVNDSAIGDNVKLMLISENGNQYMAKTKRVEREDVASQFNNPLIKNSGFKANLSFSDVPQGVYKLAVLLAQNDRYIQCESALTGNVN